MIKYEDYQKLIQNLANRFHLTTGIEKDELISEANLEFILCQQTYDPTKAKFSTYLTIKIRGRFLNMARLQKAKPIMTETEIPTNATAEELLFFKDILSELSEDGKMVCKVIFETPKDLLDMVINLNQPRGINKHQIQKHLRKEGWAFTRIWNTFKEISEVL